jgi:hypothetical protein
MAKWATSFGCWKKLENKSQSLSDAQSNHQRALRRDYRGLPNFGSASCRYKPRYLIARTSNASKG